MDDEQRLHLQKMIAANDTEDHTEAIRNAQHSDLIKEDVTKLLSLKTKYARLAKSNPSQFDSMCVSKCSFLFNNYTDIYNKVFKDEIDLSILNTLLSTLKEIEQGKLDQHDASYKVGTILKKLYIDSALKKSEKLDKRHKKKCKPNTDKKISWNQFKKMQPEDNNT